MLGLWGRDSHEFHRELVRALNPIARGVKTNEPPAATTKLCAGERTGRARGPGDNSAPVTTLPPTSVSIAQRQLSFENNWGEGAMPDSAGGDGINLVALTQRHRQNHLAVLAKIVGGDINVARECLSPPSNKCVGASAGTPTSRAAIGNQIGKPRGQNKTNKGSGSALLARISVDPTAGNQTQDSAATVVSTQLRLRSLHKEHLGRKLDSNLLEF